MNVSRRRYMGSKGGSIPYQRIEYLESTGEQYVNLGIYPNNNTRVLLVAEWFNNVNTGNYNPTIIGARSSTSSFYEFLLGAHQLTAKRFIYQYGSDSQGLNKEMTNVKLNYSSIGRYFYINNSLAITCANSTFSTQHPLYLFALNNIGTIERLAKARIYSLIIENNSRTYQFIPVRVGSVGYLYEVLSGELYGNAGTGEFSLGRDILTIPYQRVEYLESDGNQYIDTGIIPTSNTGISVEASPNDNNDTYICGLRNNSGDTRWCIGNSVSGYYYGYSGYLGKAISVSDNIVQLYLNYNNNKQLVVVSPSGYQLANLPSLSFSPAYNIRLFGSAGVVASYSKWNGKIYSSKITQGESVVMDLVPVRVGQIGYMYDTVSGQLFGNAGTGNFTFGSDIN